LKKNTRLLIVQSLLLVGAQVLFDKTSFADPEALSSGDNLPPASAVSTSPSNPPELPPEEHKKPLTVKEQATELQRTGKLMEARQLYEELLETSPDAFDVRLKLSDVYAAMDEPERALALRKEVLEQVPDGNYRRQVLDRLGLKNAILSLKEKKLKEALISLDEVLAVVPEDPFVLMYKALLYVRQGTPDRSIQQMNDSLTLIEDKGLKGEMLAAVVGVAIGVNQDLLKAKKVDEVILVLGRLRELTPKDPQVYYWLGSAQMQKGEKEVGLKLLEKSLEMSPENLGLKKAVAESYGRAGEIEKALVLYQELEIVAPNDAGVHLRLSDAYKRLGNRDAFLSQLKRVFELEPRQTELRRQALKRLGFDKVMKMIREKKFADALWSLKKIAEVVPEDSLVQMNIGSVHERMEHKEEAELAYRKAIELSSGNLDALSRLGRLLRDQGRLDESLRTFERLASKTKGLEYGRVARTAIADLHWRRAAQLVAYLNTIETLSGQEVKEVLEEGKQLVGRKDYASAEQVLKKYVELETENAEAYFLLSQVYTALGKENASLEQLKLSIAKDPEKIRLRQSLISGYEKFERWKEAEQEYDVLLSYLKDEGRREQVKVRQRIARGQRMLSEGDLESALQEFTAYLEVRPDEVRALKMAARIHHKLEHVEETDRIYARLIELAPKDADVYMLLSGVYRERGDEENANEQIIKFLEVEPLKSERRKSALNAVGLKKGVALFSENKLDEALEVFLKVEEIAPDDPVVLSNLGSLYAQMGRLEDAREQLERAVEIDPKNIRTHEHLAQVFVNQDELGLAIRQLGVAGKYIDEAAKKENDKKIEALGKELIRRGRVALNGDDIAEANHIFESLLQYSPDNAQAHYWLGKVRIQQDKFSEGIKGMERSVKLAPDNLDLKSLLARAYDEAGFFEKAIAVYEEILLQKPGLHVVRLALADIYFKHDFQDKANAHLQKIVAAVPDKEMLQKVFDLLGVKEYALMIEEGELDEALTGLQQAISVVPDEPGILFYIGNIYQHKKEYEKARETYLKVLELDPENMDARFSLGEVSAELKLFDDGIGYYEGFISKEVDDDKKKLAKRNLDALHKAKVSSLLAQLKTIKDDSDKQAQFLLEAKILVKKNRYKQAQRLLDGIIKQVPDNFEAVHWLAQSYLGAGKKKKGLKLLEKSLEMSPENLGLKKAVAESYGRAGEIEKALVLYQELEIVAPNDAGVHLRLSDAYKRLGNRDAFLSQLKRVFELEPRQTELRRQALKRLGFDKVMKMIREKKFADALWSLKKIAEVVPEDSLVQMNIGSVHERMEHKEEAELAYRKAIELSSGNLDALSRLGRLLRDQGRLDESLRTFERLASKTKGLEYGRVARTAIADLHWRRAAQLVAYLNTIETLSGQEVKEVLEEGKQLVGRKDYASAEQVLKKYVELETENAEAYFLLSQVYTALGKENASLEQLKLSIAKDPEKIRLRQSLISGYEKFERWKEAEQEYDVLLSYLKDEGRREQVKVRQRIARGQRMLSEGDLESALQEFTAYLEVRPDEVRALKMAARIHHKLEHVEETDRIYARLIELAPKDADVYMLLSGVYRERGDEENANEQLKRAIGLAPKKGELRTKVLNAFGLAEAKNLLEQEKPDKALRVLFSAIKIAPRVPEFHLEIGHAFIAVSEYKKAHQAAKSARRLAPKDLDVRLLYADTLKLTRKGQKAIKVYEDILGKAPGSSQSKLAQTSLSELYTQLAHKMRQDGKLDEAISEFKSVLENDPENAGAHFGLALSLSSQKKNDEALLELDEVIRIDPFNLGAYAKKASLLEAETRFAEAADAYAFAASIHEEPDKASKLAEAVMLALLKQKTKDERKEEALIFLEYMAEIFPDSETVNFYLGVYYARRQRNEESIDAYKKVIKLNPENLNVRFSLGVSYERVNDYDLAIEQYVAILKVADEGKKKSQTIERARDRLRLLEERLRLFSVTLSYSPNVSQTTYGTFQFDSFSSSFSGNVTARFRPYKSTTISLSGTNRYTGNHQTQTDSFSPSLNLSANVNLSDSFFSAGLGYSSTRSLLLEDFSGSGVNAFVSGGVRFRRIPDLVEMISRKEDVRPPEQGITEILREEKENVSGLSERRKTLEFENKALVDALKDLHLKKTEGEIKTFEVKPGNTLWGISEVLLNDPWLWPEVWNVNPDIEDPNIIYPGDKISLVYVDGKAKLLLQRAGEDLPVLDDVTYLSVKRGMALYEKGVSLIHLRRYDEAIEVFQTILNEIPADLFSLLNLGIASQRMQKYSEAQEAYVLALEQAPQNLETKFRLADLAADMGRTEESIEMLEALLADMKNEHLSAKESLFYESVRLDSPQDEVETLLASLYMIRARAVLDKLNENPDVRTREDVMAILRVAHFLFEQEEDLAARKLLETLRLWGQEEAQVYFWLAFVYMELGRPEDAVMQSELSVALAPDVMEYVLLLGNVYTSLDRLQDAEQQLRRVVAKGNNELLVEQAQYALGIVRGKISMQQEDADAALLEYQALLYKKPDDVTVLGLLGEAYEMTGRVDDAVNAYADAWAYEPENVEIMFKLARLYKRQNDEASMLVLLPDLFALQPSEKVRSAALDLLGFQEGIRLLRNDQLEESLQEFERILKVAPDDPLVLLNIAAVYQQQKNLGEAEQKFQYVLLIDPMNLTAHFRLGILYAAIARYADAIAEFEKVVSEGDASMLVVDANVQLDRLKTKEAQRLEGLEAGEPVLKTFSTSLSYNNFGSVNISLFETKSTGVRFSLSYPKGDWGTWTGSYGLTVIQNVQELGTDFANRSHLFSISVRRPLITRLTGAATLSRSYSFYDNVDTNAFFLLGRNEKRTRTQNTLSLNLNYSLHDRLNLTASYSRSSAKSSLPVGFIFNPSGRAVSRQSVTLGDISSESFSLGMNYRF